MLFLASMLALSQVVAASSSMPSPSITLPWGTWQADNYEKDGKFFTFSNVRYGKKPTGHLRFNASVYPDDISRPNAIQDSTYGPACYQIDTDRCDCPPITCPKSDQPESPFLAKATGPHAEDCLFLDLYVPASSFSSNKSLPVIVWFHGGGFLFGAKDSQENELPLYKGNGILQAAADAGEEVIFVAANYRLGPLGWLAGPTMERDGVPNAGLTDQRLVLEWVQDFVHLVGGDPNEVSAWGESAGASSILHHLMAYNGTRDPLFKRAVIMSPGFEWQFDRSSDGNMEHLLRNFTELTGCTGESVECLQKLDSSILAEKSQALYNLNKCAGHYSIGPAVDGKLISHLPAVAFDQGLYWKDMESLLVSHVADEASNFVPKFVDKEKDFDQWLKSFLPRDNLAPVRESVSRMYDAGKYGDPRHRASSILQDAFFTCNTRQLYDAYNSTERYMMQYDFLQWFGLAVHASDLLPMFWNKQLDVGKFIRKQLNYLPGFVIDWLSGGFGQFATQYQRYMVSHAIHGNPNGAKDDCTPEWKKAKGHKSLKRVMQTSFSLFGDYFNADTVDRQTTASTCNFWTEVALNISSLSEQTHSKYLTHHTIGENLEL